MKQNRHTIDSTPYDTSSTVCICPRYNLYLPQIQFVFAADTTTIFIYHRDMRKNKKEERYLFLMKNEE